MSFSKNKWVGALALTLVIVIAIVVGNIATDKYLESKIPVGE